MNKLEFMKNNNIVIFVEIDLLNNTIDIKRRYEEKLESYDIFYQHIVYNEDVKVYKEFLEGQLLPRRSTQGKTNCLYCKPSNNKIICLFYDFEGDYRKEYFYAEELNNKIKVIYNEI